jgi:hypothetical protein
MDRDADADDRGMAGSDLGCAADPRAELEVHDSRRRRTRLDRYPDVEHARRFDAFMQQERRRRRPRGADPGGGRNQRRRADRQCSPGAKERSEDFECGSPPQHTRRIGSKLEGCNGRCKPWTPVLAPLRAPGPGLRERPMGPRPPLGASGRRRVEVDGDRAPRPWCAGYARSAVVAILPGRLDVSTGACRVCGPSVVWANLHGLSRRRVAKRTGHVHQLE